MPKSGFHKPVPIPHDMSPLSLHLGLTPLHLELYILILQLTSLHLEPISL